MFESKHECDQCNADPDTCYCYAHELDLKKKYVEEGRSQMREEMEQDIKDAYQEGKTEGYAEGLRAGKE